jgi:hypothetical protein
MRIYSDSTDTKIVQSGAIIEVFSYENSRLNFGNYVDVQGQFLNPPKSELTQDEIDKKNRIQQSYSKLKATRLIDANCHAYIKTKREPYAPVMLTLTTKDNIPDLSITNPMLTLFIKRFNYELGDKTAYLKYVAIPEWQERGAVHYHVALFNMPFVAHSKLTDIWGEGYIWLTRTDRTRSVGRYLTKYMTKGFGDSRFKNHNRYTPSKGLHRPKVLYNQLQARHIKSKLPQSSLLYRKEYATEYHPKVKYDVYNLGKYWSDFVLPDSSELDDRIHDEILDLF